jgi:hypothetical protein
VAVGFIWVAADLVWVAVGFVQVGMIQNSSLSSLQRLLVPIFSTVFAKILVALSNVDGSVCTRTFQMVFLGFV